jgi:murein DD-endopeptidase MepM/ murein hydrolase activator NlpD
MEEIERGFDETERGGGAVHVQSHTRENGKVEVADYWRAAPGAGVSSESGRGSGQTMETGEDDQSPQTAESDSDDLPEMTNPVPGGRIRGCDGPPYGCGNFGASRTKDDGAEYKHQGVDIAVEPGQPVYSPVSGKIEGPPFDPYGSNSSKAGLYQGITIRTEDGYRVRVLYVDPSVMADQRVEAGTVIGKSQDLSLGYPPKGETQMTNHVHVDVMKGGQYKDPTGIFRDR